MFSKTVTIDLGSDITCSVNVPLTTSLNATEDADSPLLYATAIRILSHRIKILEGDLDRRERHASKDMGSFGGKSKEVK